LKMNKKTKIKKKTKLFTISKHKRA